MSIPTMEQRLAARQRPAGPAVMHNRWEELLFLHWEWDADVLHHFYRPRDLRIDTFEGKAYVGIVPFLMRDVHYTAPLLSGPRFNFCELNVRTYVYDAQGNPGVWFFSLECDFLPAVLAARALFGLNYQHKRMEARRAADGFLDYRCAPVWTALDQTAHYRYRQAGAAKPAEPGSLEFFLAERYRLFSLKDGGLHRGRPGHGQLHSGMVHHAPYQLGSAELAQYSELPLQWNDLSLPGRPPDHVLYARPVEVEIFALQRAG